jgi:GH24 family phage-related lysozyme (muramidase)
MLSEFHSLDPASYAALLQATMVELEGNIPTPYVDSAGIPSIGIGFNLQDQLARRLVFNAIGLDPDLYDPDEQDIIEELVEKMTSVVTDTYAPNDTDTLLARIEEAMSSVATPTLLLPDFSLDDGQINDIFQQLAQQKEGILNNTIRDIPNSRERVALMALVYQGNGLLGAKLQRAILTGDRAEAWYEIRYDSNGGNSQSPGIAKRQYIVSQLFGLYGDNITDPDTEYKKHLPDVYASRTGHPGL